MSINKQLLTDDFKQYLIDNYENGTKSIPDIAKEYNTYSNKIYRVMKKFGIKRKDRAEAQKLVLSTGKAKHPTEGTERDVKVKRKIGRSVFNKNKTLSEEEKQRRIDKTREIWYNIPEETRKKYTEKSHKAIRLAGRKGSVFEHQLVVALMSQKYKVQTHFKLHFADSQMSVDILLPVEGICVEIDGPSHWFPIYGEESLSYQVEKDLWKNQQLMAEGYTLIRVQNPKGYTSTSFIEEFIAKFVPFLKMVCAKDENGFYEINVEDEIFVDYSRVPNAV